MRNLYYSVYWFALRWKYTIGAVALVLFLTWLLIES